METSSKYNLNEQPKVDFVYMGLDWMTSDFLNWCLEHRDNLEWIKEKKTMDSKSASAMLYFDELNTIKRIDKIQVDKRC